MRRTTFNLKLSPAAEAVARRLADREGVSVEMWIAAAVVQKIVVEGNNDLLPSPRSTPRLGRPRSE
jgi:hypothetical protein